MGEAEQIVAAAVEEFKRSAVERGEPFSPEVERLRWFPLPEEVHCELQGREAPTHCGYHLDAGGS